MSSKDQVLPNQNIEPVGSTAPVGEGTTTSYQSVPSGDNLPTVQQTPGPLVEPAVTGDVPGPVSSSPQPAGSIGPTPTASQPTQTATQSQEPLQANQSLPQQPVEIEPAFSTSTTLPPGGQSGGTPPPPNLPLAVEPAGPSKHSNLPVIIGVLVLLAGIVVGGGYYFLSSQTSTTSTPVAQPSPIMQQIPTPTPTVNPTAGWKTYLNSKHGYSFRYPSNWLLLSPGGVNGDICVSSTSTDDIIELAQRNLDSCGFLADQLPNEEAEFTVQVLDKPWNMEEVPISDVTGNDISTSTTVGGTTATKIPFTEQSELPNIQATRIYFNYNNKGYLIFLKQTDKVGNYNFDYDQILSTFQFTDQSTLGFSGLSVSPTATPAQSVVSPTPTQ